jgi:hypothetical protein
MTAKPVFSFFDPSNEPYATYARTCMKTLASRVASLLALAVLSSACSGGSPVAAPVADDDEPGALRGELAVYIATFDDGSSDTRYFLRDGEGNEKHLILHDRGIDFPSGTRLKVWGTVIGDSIDVSSFKVAADVDPSQEIGSQSSALVGVAAATPRKMCVFLVDLGGGLGTITADSVNAAFFSGSKSVNAFYQENSYGKNSLTGKVVGPFPYTLTACANADTRAMATAMKAMIAPETCDQYGYVFARTSLCTWGGLGSVGSPTNPARDTWYNGGVSCVVTVQEPGHNYGMAHSSSMACGTATFADDLSTCTHSEYGDRFDPMGGGCRHMNVWQKEYEQWFGGCNSVKVTSSGTFNLLPTEIPCNGVQALQIPMAKQRMFTRPAAGGNNGGTDTLTSYYLEYRVSAGYDTGMTPAVLLHVGGNYRNQTQSGMHTWILDMHPGGTAGFNDAGFKAGETFSDPAGGVSFTVNTMDADKATITVDIPSGTGDPTCLDGTTLAGPGAPTCGGGGVFDAGLGGTGGAGGSSGAGGAGGGGIGGSTGAGGSPRVDAGIGAGGGPDAGNMAIEAGSQGAAGNVIGAGGSVGSGAGGDVSQGSTGGSAGAALGAGGNAEPGLQATQGASSGKLRQRPDISDVEGGCACRFAPLHESSGRGTSAALLAIAFAGLAGERRRRRVAATS